MGLNHYNICIDDIMTSRQRKKTTKPKRRAKGGRGKRRRSKGSLVLSRNPKMPIPSKIIVPFQFSTNYILDSANDFWSVTIPANSPRLPNAATYIDFTNMALNTAIAATTDQPNCWTNYFGPNALFLQYRVLSSSVRVLADGMQTSNGHLLCAISPTTNAQGFATWRTASQSPYCKIGQSEYAQLMDIKMGLSTAKHYGVPHRHVIDDDHFAGFYNPSLVTYTVPPNDTNWCLTFSLSSGAVTAVNTFVQVFFTWNVMFEEPNYTGSYDN